SKAAYLVQCANFVRHCSLGQWSEWMRINMTTFCLHESYAALVVNRSGHDCPYSLRIIGCLLHCEITSFSRETDDKLPKLSTMSTTNNKFRQKQQQQKQQPQQRTNNPATSAPPTVVEISSSLTDKRSNDRIRMGSVVSQTSNTSSASMSSKHPGLSLKASSVTIPPVLSTIPATVINMNSSLSSERHIYFAVNKENDSNDINHTFVMMNDEDGVIIIDGNSSSSNVERRTFNATHIPGRLSRSSGKVKLIRRSSVKLRKSSLRMKESGRNMNTHRSSYRTHRRSHASNISSETDGHQSGIGSLISDNIINTRPSPWTKVVIRILSNVNLICDHQIKSVSDSYGKQTSSCNKNLIQTLLNIYRLSSSSNLTNTASSSSTHRSTTHLKRNDTTSNFFFFLVSTCLFREGTGQNVDNVTKTTNTTKPPGVPMNGMVFEVADPHLHKQTNTHFTIVAHYLEKQARFFKCFN
ncbi:unnamed protein product, partial [Adineta steineri]